MKGKNSSIVPKIQIIHDRRKVGGTFYTEVTFRSKRSWMKHSRLVAKHLIDHTTEYVPIRCTCICRDSIYGKPYRIIEYNGFPPERVDISHWSKEDHKILLQMIKANNKPITNPVI